MKCATTISLLREYDMKSKGVGNANISDGELLNELIFNIMLLYSRTSNYNHPKNVLNHMKRTTSSISTQPLKKAVFLDRDGTSNSDEGHYYIYNPEDFVFNPGVIEGLKRLQKAGYLLIVITNQGGIAKAIYTR